MTRPPPPSHKRSERAITREVQASKAKTNLSQLLDDVERGETIIITCHGRPTARIVPEPHRRQQEIDRALADIQEPRKHTGKISIDEILGWRHEGHKY
jgi:prevent-host-death family protein